MARTAASRTKSSILAIGHDQAVIRFLHGPFGIGISLNGGMAPCVESLDFFWGDTESGPCYVNGEF